MKHNALVDTFFLGSIARCEVCHPKGLDKTTTTCENIPWDIVSRNQPAHETFLGIIGKSWKALPLHKDLARLFSK